MRGMDAHTGAELSGRAHLAQSVQTILTTPVGSRVMRRDFGSDLPDLIDAPITPANAVDLYAATAVALDRWEPRLLLTRVTAREGESGQVILDLAGIWMADGERLAIEGIILQ